MKDIWGRNKLIYWNINENGHDLRVDNSHMCDNSWHIFLKDTVCNFILVKIFSTNWTLNHMVDIIQTCFQVHFHSMWDEITYLLSNFKVCAFKFENG